MPFPVRATLRSLAVAVSASLLGGLAWPRGARGEECPVPSPSSAVDAALVASGLADADTVSLRRRARGSRLLPESARLELHGADGDVFRAESRLDQDFDAELLSDGADVTDLQRSGVDSVRELRIVVTWDLAGAVWSDADLQIERLERELRADRASLAERVLTLYFDWLAASAALGSSEAPPVRDVLAARELEARLDALTGGWFSRARACTDRDERVDAAP